MNKSILLLIILALLFMVSCSTLSNRSNEEKVYYTRGIWHRMEEGQTLWRIAKTYSVSLETIKKANDIVDVLHIAPGTWIFIPGVKKHLYVQGSLAIKNMDSKKFYIQLPVIGNIIRKFGKLRNDFNYGIDIKTRSSKYVISSQGGTVIYSGFLRGYGSVIIIDHGNNFYSLYTRDIDPIVKDGQKIELKTIIAKTIKKKGEDSAIIHFELYYKGKPVNPLYYVQ